MTIYAKCTNCRGTGRTRNLDDDIFPTGPTCIICNGEGVVNANDQTDAIGERLICWAREQQAWSEKTFGPKEVKTAEGPIKHMVKELLCEFLGYDRDAVDGFLLAFATINRKPMVLYDIEEDADLMFFINELLWRHGHQWSGLIAAMEAKLAKNKARNWPAFDINKVNQPVEHIRVDEVLRDKNRIIDETTKEKP